MHHPPSYIIHRILIDSNGIKSRGGETISPVATLRQRKKPFHLSRYGNNYTKVFNEKLFSFRGNWFFLVESLFGFPSVKIGSKLPALLTRKVACVYFSSIPVIKTELITAFIIIFQRCSPTPSPTPGITLNNYQQF